MTPTYRILDANLNRAREGLRVLEELARMALDDQELTARLKGLRHALAVHERPTALALLAARNAPGDVGAFLDPASEMQRTDWVAVAIAAAKRVEESLRTLEEYQKLAGANGVWPNFKAIRFAVYAIEPPLVARLARRDRLARVQGLYAILDPAINPPADLFALAQAVIRGGATVVQLRYKIHEQGRIYQTARALAAICRQGGALFIVNDHVDIALAVDADGVHLGQDDLPIAAARQLLPADRLIGLSTHSVGEARAAAEAGADYIGVGAMYPTLSKERTVPSGLPVLRAVRAAVSLPLVAIGGITAETAEDCALAGANAVAVIRALMVAPNPELAARQLRAAFDAGRPTDHGSEEPDA